jgi:preprotein translocase subunit YajC
MFIAVFVAIFYLLILRPQNKREKERKAMLSKLAKGDRVVTSGGILGTVVGLTDKTAVLRVNDDPPQKIEFLRGAISQVVHREDESLETS